METAPGEGTTCSHPPKGISFGVFPSLNMKGRGNTSATDPRGPAGLLGEGKHMLIWRKHMDISLVASGKALALEILPSLFPPGLGGWH